MGAWIEMGQRPPPMAFIHVAPYMGAWIEIRMQFFKSFACIRRSLHGSVD